MNLEISVGLIIVALVMFDVFQTVLVPHWTSDTFRLSPHLLHGLWSLWKFIAGAIPARRPREGFLGAFAPFALVATLILWTLLLILGFGIMLYAVRATIEPVPESLAEACYFAGVTFFSLGYGDISPEGRWSRVVAVAASASGLAITAMVISLIFTLHSAFGRREQLVLTLASRAGVPPSGVELLEHYGRSGLRDHLPRLFAEWEGWVAGLMVSHRPYHHLTYYRSSYRGESWVASLGAMLDAAVLVFTTVEGGAEGDARSFQSLGLQTATELNLWFTRRPTTPPELSREQWAAARERLSRAGYKLKEEDDSWRLFSAARALHAGEIHGLAAYLAVDPPAWLQGRPARIMPGRRGARGGRYPAVTCRHVEEIADVAPQSTGCLECLNENERWVALRLCLTCGFVGCCDSSANQHARRHFEESRHPIMRSIEAGEDWGWCWIDEMQVELPEPRPDDPAARAGRG